VAVSGGAVRGDLPLLALALFYLTHCRRKPTFARIGPQLFTGTALLIYFGALSSHP
jgi:hypothetical protein